MSLIERQVDSRTAEALPLRHGHETAIRAEVEAARPSVICTLGMHRSGTSLAARVLNLLGVDLGPSGSMASVGWDNPKGYWELPPVVILNDEILAHFGGGWNKPPVFPADWPHDPDLSDIRERARQLLSQTFAQKPMWGWKDPRTCLTLPFWQDLIGPMRYVVCVRNPSAVLASLNRRDAIEAEHAERLWLAYVEASLTGTSDHPRMFVVYEDLISNWVTEVRRLAAFIGHPERGEDPQVLASIGEFLDPELCHHRMSVGDLAASRRISFAAKGLYVALRAGAGRPPAVENRGTPVVADKALTLLATSAREMFERTVAHEAAFTPATEAEPGTPGGIDGHIDGGAIALAAEHDALVRELEAQAAAMAALQHEQDLLNAEVARLTVRAAERAAEAAHLAAALAGQAAENARLRQFAVREQELRISGDAVQADLQALAAERARDLVAARGVLEEIHASAAWRLITRVRNLVGRVLPPGTSRRRFYTALVSRFTRQPTPR